jgi:hypothetical protein
VGAESLLDVISSLNQIFPFLAIPLILHYQRFLRSCKYLSLQTEV